MQGLESETWTPKRTFKSVKIPKPIFLPSLKAKVLWIWPVSILFACGSLWQYRNVKKEYKCNEEIRANEVRVVAIASGERGQLEDSERFWLHQVTDYVVRLFQDSNQIMSLQSALEIARDKGVDVILINEAAEVSVSI